VMTCFAVMEYALARTNSCLLEFACLRKGTRLDAKIICCFLGLAGKRLHFFMPSLLSERDYAPILLSSWFFFMQPQKLGKRYMEIKRGFLIRLLVRG
jgi:hypothetical protein